MTFASAENAVLYQNYKEKALDVDSEEESEPKEQKVDKKPVPCSWSQLSAVSAPGSWDVEVRGGLLKNWMCCLEVSSPGGGHELRFWGAA